MAKVIDTHLSILIGLKEYLQIDDFNLFKDRTKMTHLEELTSKRNIKLPSLPAIGLKILESIKDNNFSIEELTSSIAADPALTAKTLSMANSALYSPPSKVESLNRAVQVLGSESLKNIALSFVIMSGFKQKTNGGFDYDLFWRRAITAAVAAESISKHFTKKSADIFITSLLMDIGIVVMYICEPEKYIQVLEADRTTDSDVIYAERNVFGFDHQEIGRDFLRDWDIPESIYSPIAFHHALDSPPAEIKDTIEILRISNIVSSLYNGHLTIKIVEKLQNTLKEETGMNLEEINAYIDEVADKSIEVLESFNIDSRDIKPYSEILNEANEELSKMNVSYAQLVIELKLAKEKAERMAKELEKANKLLRQLAFQDPLTSLYNHRYFQEQMDKEIHRANRYSQYFTLIIFDVDIFKEVNDRFGHIHGDKVLSTIGKFLLALIRDSDIAARYGGDEFTCLLPSTDLKEAAIFAERLRKMAEEHEIETDEGKIKFTLSIGVGTYMPEKKALPKAEIIDMVDKALYISKREGRNRVTLLNP